jgi:hypothetical protein
MKRLLIACLIAAVCAPAGAQRQSPDQVIRESGALVITDGASYYRFNRDSSFDSGPLGISGRIIKGRWRGDGQPFIIEGQWTWINGASASGDYRRMTMHVGGTSGSGTDESLILSGRSSSARIHRVYFHIDEIVPLPRTLGDTRSTDASGAVRNYGIRLDTKHLPGVATVQWRGITTFGTRRCTLEIDFTAQFSPTSPPPTQVWLLRNDGTVVAPTQAAVVSGVGFPGAGPPKVAYHYDCAVEREALSVVVRLGDEFLVQTLRK